MHQISKIYFVIEFYDKKKFWIFDASSWLFYTKLITMHGHLNIKSSVLFYSVQWDCFLGLNVITSTEK